MRLKLLLLICILPTCAEAFEFSRCQISNGSVIVDAQCAELQRPEDPADPQGKQIDLQVVKFRARTPEPEKDALTIIQGGPGMSSIDLALSLRGVFSAMLAKRDLLVIDQRGTGRSNMLSCEFDEELNYAEFSVENTHQVAHDCLQEIDGNPRFYTTSLAVQDLDAVRQAAGYAQLSLYGVSYGTRVAQHYLRRFPEQTRVMILDGVADVGLNLAGGEIARRSQQAFDRLVERCKRDSDCTRTFGDLAQKFAVLRTRLKNEPVTLRLAHPVSGEFIQETLTEQHLLGLIRLLPYATESLSLLPFILHQAEAENYVPMAAQTVLTEEQFGNDYAYAMNNSVVCAEDAPFLTDADLQGQANTYFGETMSLSMQALCDVWPRGPVDADFREPFESFVPVLLMSGENDPITPPENAERALKMFPNGLHVTVPGHGHGVIARGCVPQLATEFVESGQVTELATECVKRERALPFFVSPAGPTP